VTMVGLAKRLQDDEMIASARGAFLEVNPKAAYYADFKDFSWWRLEVESIRYIGGYGRMSWVENKDWFQAKPDPIRKIADGILTHMNEDHTEAMISYCRAFTQAKEVESVRMTGVDQYGFEMSVQTEKGPRPVRLAFSEVVSSGMEIRNEMKRLAKESRALLDGK
jgi:putative heme iron utilization protein